ncbi:hypothetical protein IWZ01DRAFT_128870 [Phyllosticta capitalensis]
MAKPLVVGLVAALLLVGCGGGCQPVEGVVTGAVQRERKKILQGLIPRDYSATRHHYSPKRGEDWSGQGCGELLVSGHYWSGVSVEKMEEMEEMEGSLEHAWGKKRPLLFHQQQKSRCSPLMTRMVGLALCRDEVYWRRAIGRQSTTRCNRRHSTRWPTVCTRTDPAASRMYVHFTCAAAAAALDFLCLLFSCHTAFGGSQHVCRTTASGSGLSAQRADGTCLAQ